MEIEEYRKLIEVLARTESDLIFRNADRKHASIVLAHLIRASKKSVIIYDDDISGDIADSSPDIRDAIIHFLEDGDKTITILYKEDVNLGMEEDAFKEFLLKLKKQYPETMQLVKMDSSTINNINRIFKGNINFAIGDNNKFRIEGPSGKIREAYCSFNNLKYPKKLLEAMQ